MRFMPHTDADVRAMLDAIGVVEHRRFDRPRSRQPPQHRRAIALAPGMSEQDVAAEVTALADKNRAADLDQLSRRRLLQSLRSRGRSLGDFARRIRDQLHALSGRGQSGHHAGDLRISNAHHAAHRPRGRQRQHVRRRFRRGRGGVDGAAHRAQAIDRRALARAVAGLSRDDSRPTSARCRASRSSRFPSMRASGQIDLGELRTLANENLLCVVAGYPNGFGIIEPLGEIARNRASGWRPRDFGDGGRPRARTAEGARRSRQSISRSARDRASACRSSLADPGSVSWPRATRICARCPDAWSARLATPTAIALSR